MDVDAHRTLEPVGILERAGDDTAAALRFVLVEAVEQALDAEHGDLLAQAIECPALLLLWQRGFFDGSIRVGCWDWACGGQEPSSRGTWLGRPLQGPSPAEIVRQVARRD